MKEILARFGLMGEPIQFGDGHINTTYRVGDFVLQKINTGVFHEPHGVMDNAFAVTEHIRQKGGLTLEFLRTVDGEKLVVCPDGAWRAYRFIPGTHTETTRKTPEILYNVAVAIGEFQHLLADFDATRLFTVIPDFHNTPKRVQNLYAAIERNAAGRADSVKEEISFARQIAPLAGAIEDAIADGTVPLRVSHNDTKLNNILLDDRTGKGVCLIDLDTVMSGSYLHDFGDAIRFGATLAAEDCTDLDTVTFDLDLFEAFTKGYLESAASVLTAREKELLFTSAVLMTYECGTRFLADHLDGDVYFHIAHPGHNLERARNQFALVRDMLTKKDKAEAIVKKYC